MYLYRAIGSNPDNISPNFRTYWGENNLIERTDLSGNWFLDGIGQHVLHHEWQ